MISFDLLEAHEAHSVQQRVDTWRCLVAWSFGQSVGRLVSQSAGKASQPPAKPWPLTEAVKQPLLMVDLYDLAGQQCKHYITLHNELIDQVGSSVAAAHSSEQETQTGRRPASGSFKLIMRMMNRIARNSIHFTSFHSNSRKQLAKQTHQLGHFSSSSSSFIACILRTQMRSNLSRCR